MRLFHPLLLAGFDRRFLSPLLSPWLVDAPAVAVKPELVENIEITPPSRPMDNSMPMAAMPMPSPAEPAEKLHAEPAAFQPRPIGLPLIGPASVWSVVKSHVQPWLPQIVLVWFAGVVVVAMRLLLSWRTVRHLRRFDVSPAGVLVQSVLERTAQKLRLSRAVEVLQSTLVRTPAVLGWFRPLILLPACVVTGLPPGQLESILAHELAHIRRHDYLVNLLQTLVETIFFYHPAVWWLSRQIRNERENCCDDVALGIASSRADYGRALLAIEELRAAWPSLSLAASGGSLLARIRRIAGCEPPPRVIGGSSVLGVILVSLAIAVAATWAAEPAGEKPVPTAIPDVAKTKTGGTIPPLSLHKPEPKSYWSLTLKETLRFALQNSRVMHQIGGQVQGPPSFPAANPIAAPTVGKTDGTIPDFKQGVFIARASTDISLTAFETGVRNLVCDVETVYWELYFDYHALDAAVQGRDSALKTWQQVDALYKTGAGDASSEAQAREQYFLFRTQAEDAMSTLYHTENKLRYMMGLAATDGRLIRPADEPTTAKISFDWAQVWREAMARSPEIREQRWRVKQRELELIAVKKFLPSPTEIQAPIAFRKQNDGAKNAELALARERTKLRETELDVSHQLADAVRDMDANLPLAETKFNRRLACHRNVEAVQTLFENGRMGIGVFLEAQRRLLQAESDYFRSRINYAKSISQVHYRKGSLPEYYGIYLAELAAPPTANDSSSKTSAAMPVDEVPPASDQSTTKEGATTRSKPASAHSLTIEPNADQSKAIAEVEKLGGKVTLDEKSPGKPVISVVLQETNVTDAELEYLKGLTQLQSLNLVLTHVTDAGLANLEGMTNLQRLDLFGTKVTDAGLMNLKGMTKLQVLDLIGTKVTDTGLANLKGMTKLQTLNLIGTKVTDAGLANLKDMTKLRTLILSQTDVTGVGLGYLKGLHDLKTLVLIRTQVTDAGLASLTALPQLRILMLSDTKVTDAGLEHLKGLTNLKTLYLDGTDVTDAGLKDLKGWTKLQSLAVSKKVTDAGLKQLQGMTTLQSLRLGGDSVTDADLEDLKGLTSLQRLDLSVTNVTDAGLEHLKVLTILQRLTLSAPKVTDAGLEHLKGLTNLHALHLWTPKVTGEGLKKLQQALPNCKIDHDAKSVASTPAPAPPKANDPSGKTSVEKAGSQIVFAGSCHDEQGRAVANAQVSLFIDDYAASSNAPLQSIRTDQAGRFRLQPVAASSDGKTEKSYWVSAAAKGRASVVLNQYDRRLRDPGHLQIAMPEAASLRGKIRGPDGRPVAGAKVWTTITTEPIDGINSATSNAGGLYEISDLEKRDGKPVPVPGHPGAFAQFSPCLRVQHPHFAQETTSFSEVPGTIDVPLQTAAAIEGRVIYGDSEKPAAGARLYAESIWENGVHPRGGGYATTDSDGRYRFDSLPGGKYDIILSAAKGGYTMAALESFEATAGATKRAPDLQLVHGGLIVGRVIHADTGKPFRPVSPDHLGPSPYLRMYGPSRPRSGGACETASIQDDGSFQLRAAPGRNDVDLQRHIARSLPGVNSIALEDYLEAVSPGSLHLDVAEGETVTIEFKVRKKAVTEAEAAGNPK